MNNITSKRFVVRKSLLNTNTNITFTTKKGKQITYSHDKVFNIMKDLLGESSGVGGELSSVLKVVGNEGKGVVVLIREAKPTKFYNDINMVRHSHNLRQVSDFQKGFKEKNYIFFSI